MPWFILFVLPRVRSSFQNSDAVAISEICQFDDTGNLQIQNYVGTFREYDEYTIEWVVNILGGRNAAEEIANKYGFINFGQVNFLVECI